ncbi:MAG TPA: M1 family aminopeptidase, partial [Thermoanaerobaculia bacterium]|nr:M1 family aminopeptidase [Thermoanaerobaculia bacterium]
MKIPQLASLLPLFLALPLALSCASSAPPDPSPGPGAAGQPAGQTPPATPTSPATPATPAAPVAPATPATGADIRPDPHSFARPAQAAVEHLKLDLTVDFPAKKLAGRASLRLANHGATRLHLDTRDLDIQRVTLGDGTTEAKEAKWTLGDVVPHLGQELTVEIIPDTRWVSIDYSTRPEAAALQWLSPEQAGGTQPFLFTQSQAILARTWIPLQDSPGIRMTYEATIRAPRGLLAVMSAENPTEKTADGIYRFRMPQAIPSYLMALSVGDLAFRPLGDPPSNRAGVYALPTVVERAAWELADTPKMIAAAEKLYGPYRWGRYDLLILPASYPFGGMENPRLTFATPTILAGDRSLVSLVAHELAHSWSGNLVTNATWNDFWLNEGFTTYFERRIMEAVYGRTYEEMLASLGRQDLADTVEELGAGTADTHLRLALAGRDPDDGMTDIAYEKGALLLRTLEEAVGREAWDRFVRGWFESHAFQSATTDGFLAYLQQNLLAKRPGVADKVRLASWIDGPDVPENAAKPSSDAFRQVEAQIAALGQGTAAAQLGTANWTTHEWLHFLRNLPRPVPAARLADLDAAFRFSQSGNSEILTEWLLR